MSVRVAWPVVSPKWLHIPRLALFLTLTLAKNKLELYLAVFAPISVTDWNAYEHSWTINVHPAVIGFLSARGTSGV